MAMLEYLQMKYTGIDLSNLDVYAAAARRAGTAGAFAAGLRLHPAGGRRGSAQILLARGRSTADLALLRLRLDPRHRTGGEPQGRRFTKTLAHLHHARVPAHAGDAQDYSYAYSGGDGTVSGTDPGRVLAEQGTCRQELWPDEKPAPAKPERVLISDSEKHHLDATPHPIALDDVRKVLSAGCPVHVAINTGPLFSQVGRDGVFNAAGAAQWFSWTARHADRRIHRRTSIS